MRIQITERIKRLFKKKSAPKTDFSEFFVSATDKEKEELLREVVRKANQDQQDLIKRYENTIPKVA